MYSTLFTHSWDLPWLTFWSSSYDNNWQWYSFPFHYDSWYNYVRHDCSTDTEVTKLKKKSLPSVPGSFLAAAW